MNAIVFFTAIAACCYVGIAVVGLGTRPSRQSALWLSLVALYGLMRFATMRGLLRMKRYGAILEIVSAVLWIAVSIYFLLYFLKGQGGDFEKLDIVSLVVILTGAAFAVFEIAYLGRPSMLRRMAGRDASGVPLSRRFEVATWAAIAVAFLELTIFFAHSATKLTRSHQKRTIASMILIAYAWEARAKDLQRYNGAAMMLPTHDVSVDTLFKSLSPTYARDLPQRDAWGNAWQLGIDAPWSAGAPARGYVIISYGRDGRSEGTWHGGYTTDFDCDLVYSNGVFLQWPDGVATQ